VICCGLPDRSAPRPDRASPSTMSATRGEELQRTRAHRTARSLSVSCGCGSTPRSKTLQPQLAESRAEPDRPQCRLRCGSPSSRPPGPSASGGPIVGARHNADTGRLHHFGAPTAAVVGVSTDHKARCPMDVGRHRAKWSFGHPGQRCDDTGLVTNLVTKQNADPEAGVRLFLSCCWCSSGSSLRSRSHTASAIGRHTRKLTPVVARLMSVVPAQ
jgi:hypothetical protein